MRIESVNRREFMTAGAALTVASAMHGCAAPGTVGTVAADGAQRQTGPVAAPEPGRLTFHGIDTFNGATIATLKVDVSMLDGGAYRLVKSFDTAANGRSNGAVFEGATFKRGRYELSMHVGDYFAALNTKLPSPSFLSRVPVRFGIADESQRYHIAVLFGPWSYSYYRGS